MMNLSLGFSPCPNDTFIFDAWVNKKIAADNIEAQVHLEDIQTLNEWAAQGRLDVTKLSFPAYFNNRHQYEMLDAGAALGKGVGPLLVAKKMFDISNIENATIAIPGHLTTANFLLSYAFPFARHKQACLFSDIEDEVLSGKADLGVIIHENRFTYQQKGLHKICDLGEIWEQREGLPIPLACIAVKKDLAPQWSEKISRLIRESVGYAFAHYPEISNYTRQHAQAMSDKVVRKHIELYVNDYTKDLGTEGRTAISRFEKIYQQIMAKPATN